MISYIRRLIDGNVLVILIIKMMMMMIVFAILASLKIMIDIDFDIRMAHIVCKQAESEAQERMT